MSDGESIAGREREVTFHTTGALTREQVEEVFNAVYWHGDQQGAKQCKVLDGIDALRATIEQQAQELGRLKQKPTCVLSESGYMCSHCGTTIRADNPDWTAGIETKKGVGPKPYPLESV